MKAGLWAKAFADSDGDERVAKAAYIRLRAVQLQDQHDEQQQALKLARDLALQAEQEKQKAQEAEVAEVLAKMTEAKRAEALLPKGKCPACGDVIPLASEQCPKCTALFTADSNWRVTPLSKYEALVQKAADDEVVRATRTKEEKESDSARQLIFLGVLVIIFVLGVLIRSDQPVVANLPQSVVYPGVFLSCFISHALCLPAVPALARCRVPRPHLLLMLSSACMSRVRVSGSSLPSSRLSCSVSAFCRSMSITPALAYRCPGL